VITDDLVFEPKVQASVAEALHSLYNLSVPAKNVLLSETRKDFTGDTTLVVFPYIKASKKSPEQTAEDIGNYIKSNCDVVASFNVVKGFLNIVIDDSFWNQFYTQSTADVKQYLNLQSSVADNRVLMVEYSSPNTNKPLHLGHIRNNLLGYSVAELLKATGNKVVKTNLVNDRGIHICKSMLAWKKFGNGETPVSSGMKGDHLVGKYYVEFDKNLKQQVKEITEKTGLNADDAEKKASLMLEVQEMLRKWEAGDKETVELWKRMNGWVYEGFDESYRKLGVDFDKIYYESQTYLLGKKIVEEGLAKKVFYKKEDGSVWVNLTDVGLDEKVLLRSDGTSVYITQDLGTAQLRFDEYDGLQQLIYVVGNEQEYHFKVLKEIFKKLGRPWAEGLFHLSYGMVDLPSGKMKSREGTVVDADDLIKEITDEAEATTKSLGKLDDFDSEEAKHLYHVIAMGALKYFILKVDPKKRMLFNPAESIDLNGNTGPFIQYTYARIRSVIRKGIWDKNHQLPITNYDINKEEKELLKLLYRYGMTINEAAEGHSPALVANYIYEVAKSFNYFYHNHVIVDETNESSTAFRLKLSALTSEVIKECMRMLGIEVPERM
jgi:arginyl-tRNA synthetase